MFEIIGIISLIAIFVALVQRRKAKKQLPPQGPPQGPPQRFVNPTYPGSTPFTPPSNDGPLPTAPPQAPPPIPTQKEDYEALGKQYGGLIGHAYRELARKEREKRNE